MNARKPRRDQCTTRAPLRLPLLALMKARLAKILLACALLLAAVSWAKPGYIDLDIRLANQQGGGAFWWEQHYSELAYADSPGVSYVHRQVGTAYTDRYGWKTSEDALAFFEQQLATRGWRRVEPAGSDPSLPESRLLSPANLRRYISTDRPDAGVLVAVWPVGGSVEGFHVVLTTTNTSLLKRLSAGLD
ncbi:MAG: hypothetical protein HY852_00910 [Bradyrhizobium sp.]|uniref:hypothetical protein n=1 Tax=Bradyrhizobium sp. TaxID=376 RepID=UPI0025BF97F0|nr:hypothetical protein [Bradyrhizobium sp.]MBI5260360.1 hypothetical protein [Bradyrhizobium sp.]